MFTGIIETIGSIQRAEVSDANLRLTIAAPRLGLHQVAIGDSISVNGCCLTVTHKTAETFSVDVSNETLSKTTLGDWQAGTPVNLERALRTGDELGGHVAFAGTGVHRDQILGAC